MTATTNVHPFWLAGEPVERSTTHEVRNPFDGSLVAEISVPGAEDVERAVRLAADMLPASAGLPAHVRATALALISRRLTEDRERFAQTITAESGKPIRWARIEVARAAGNFQRASEAAKRFSGEVVRLDEDPSGTGRVGIVRRFPIGPVLGITPFNFPLNLVAHKVAPALAVGAPIILKPAPQTPLTALLLAELVAESELPAGVLSVLPLPNGALLDELVRDPRLPILSYTGSEIGWKLKAAVPRKRVLLELGGNAAAIVHRDADPVAAAQSIAAGAFIQAGQTCISTQRVFVHTDLEAAFTDALVETTRSLRAGDPSDPETFVGPMVSVAAAERVEQWIDEAQQEGARLLCGGERDGSTLTPAVIAGGSQDSRLWRDEVFGPVVAIAPFDEIDDAFARVNESRYGLQAGIFTSDIQIALRAHRELEVGTVIVGDSPSFRADALPYGGWKDSGVGREGIPTAMDELTAPRGLVLSGF